MCFILHIASTGRVPRVRWNENDRHLCVEDVRGDEDQFREHFSLPEVAFVGSSLGCGCGFRSVSFQNGEWPEEWLIEEGGHEAPDDHEQDHRELYDLVTSLVSGGHSVELYGCWNGDERAPTEHLDTIPAVRLLEHGFWFRERGSTP